nr:hypothetical protein [Tanacetum cinerariifolium]
AHVPSQQELDLLFGPLYDEFFNAGSNPQATQSTTNIQPTSAPSTPTYVHAEENNGNQEKEEHLPDDEFTNPFCVPLQELVESSSHNIDQFRAPTAQDMEILIQTCLMPLALKTQNDSFIFVHELKQETHADLKYVESLEKEIDKLESNKVEFSNMYDMILQEIKECDSLAQKLSKQTESVSKEIPPLP